MLSVSGCLPHVQNVIALDMLIPNAKQKKVKKRSMTKHSRVGDNRMESSSIGDHIMKVRISEEQDCVRNRDRTSGCADSNGCADSCSREGIISVAVKAPRYTHTVEKTPLCPVSATDTGIAAGSDQIFDRPVPAYAVAEVSAVLAQHQSHPVSKPVSEPVAVPVLLLQYQ